MNSRKDSCDFRRKFWKELLKQSSNELLEETWKIIHDEIPDGIPQGTSDEEENPEGIPEQYGKKS